MADGPGAPHAYVRLTHDALEDLRRLLRVDPQIVRAALKKMLLLQRDPNAGHPLVGNLIGWRKLVIGNRDWRLVWKVSTDADGAVVIDIAEVWAVGVRSDAEVYTEVEARIARADATLQTLGLAEVLTKLKGMAKVIAPATEPLADPVPPWLANRLTVTAGYEGAVVHAMTGADAMDAWDRFQLGEGVAEQP